MGILDIFRRKKKEVKVEEKVEEKVEVTELERLCGEDKEIYKALANTMFLDPRKIKDSLEQFVKKAKEFEKKKDLLRARVNYEIAGGLALYKGDIKKVRRYFEKCKELSPDKEYLILNNLEKAVAIAQEYYNKYLKTEEAK